MELETLIIQTLTKVHAHELNVMESFDILSKALSEEFDKINDRWARELEELDF